MTFYVLNIHAKIVSLWLQDGIGIGRLLEHILNLKLVRNLTFFWTARISQIDQDMRCRILSRLPCLQNELQDKLSDLEEREGQLSVIILRTNASWNQKVKTGDHLV